MLGLTLRDWREGIGISLYSIAKEENTRIENITKVEQGSANMVNLVRYLDFIRKRDSVFFDKILTQWKNGMGYE